MIYEDVKLEKREYTPLFMEQTMINECQENINTIIGNHRDEDNTFAKKLMEFEKSKMVRKALMDILKIKEDLYNDTGVKL